MQLKMIIILFSFFIVLFLACLLKTDHIVSHILTSYTPFFGINLFFINSKKKPLNYVIQKLLLFIKDCNYDKAYDSLQLVLLNQNTEYWKDSYYEQKHSCIYETHQNFDLPHNSWWSKFHQILHSNYRRPPSYW